ncbi:MAG: Amicyanin-alpha precursor [bacterium ADurb.Bin400]|nr:MAG: Amicyanin-alpha precursor [bacterium ADurb.Bin400]
MSEIEYQTVVIAGDSYQPDEIVVDPGTEIVWQNDDEESHTVHSDTELFNSGEIEPGYTWSYVFKEKGMFNYHCDYHSSMAGRVVVE